jgi:restriction endonuclease
MIHRTIKEHLDKEKRLRPQGIKVLSLFFIDAVEKYRQYDADGNPVKGDYAASSRRNIAASPGIPITRASSRKWT